MDLKGLQEEGPEFEPCMDNHNRSRPNSVALFGPYRLIAVERLLKKGNEPIPLGSRAVDILIALVERAGEVVTHRELIARVWPNVTIEEANLRVHIAGLRKALGDGRKDTRYIVNVSGRGYCFVAPVTCAKQRRISPPVAAFATCPLKNLPARLTRMVGRDDLVLTLSEQLMLWRFVSIVGPGGIGKTTVAVSVAHTLFDGFNGAVFFIDLAALTDPQLVPTAVASALGLVVRTSDPLDSLLTFIDHKKMLLVLDNCEHVIDIAAPLAEHVVSKAPQAHVLTTSREALRAEGERVHLLYALDCPPEYSDLTAAEALRYPAVQLFMERAAASGYQPELSNADAPIVARICRRLDGIPLAIELAGSRVGSNGIRGTTELLDKRFSLLWHGRRTALPRHRTLNAMLDWSYNLIPNNEKVVLCRLSVFVGDFTLEAACAVASEMDADDADVANAVANLVTKSLIVTTTIDGTAFFRLLDTTRSYAAAKLAEHTEANATARRHVIYYSKFLARDEILQSRYGEHDLSGYAPHIGNVRAALDWALSDRGDATAGVELAAWAAPLFVGLSLLEECKRWCAHALGALDDAVRGTRQEMILQEALALSSMFTGGNSGEVQREIERGLALAEALGDRLHQLQLLYGLNIFLTRFGDFRGALAAVEKAGSIAQVVNDPAGLIIADWMLGASHHLVGDQVTAQRYLERGVSHAAEFGTINTHFFGFDHRTCRGSVLARTLWLRGFSERACTTAQITIDETASRNDPLMICYSLSYCSMVFLWAGDLDKATDLIERLISQAERHALRPYEAIGIALKGEVAMSRNDPETGLNLLRNALEILHRVHHNVVTTHFTGMVAECLVKRGQFDEALLTINGAIAHSKNGGPTFNLPELLRIKAHALAAAPQHGRAPAIDCLKEALAAAHDQSALAFELQAATDLARLLSEGGQRDEAGRTLALVYDRFTEGFETSDLRIAHQLIKDLA